MDVLGLLEREVFGRIRFWGPRKAIIKIGEPLNLASYFPRYKADKRGAIQEVTTSLESSVRQMQAELDEIKNSEMWRAGAAVRELRPERHGQK